MKKIALLFSALMLLTGCSTAGQGGTVSGADTNAATEATTGGAGAPTRLVLSTFGLSADVSEDEVYKPFEEANNVDIVTETGTAAERYTKFSSNPDSEIDVIELSQALAAQGVEAGLFEDLDLSKLENSNDLIDVAKAFAEAGNGIAYTVNSIGIIYDPTTVGMEPTTFDDLWNTALAGQVSIPEITTTFGPAMVYVASDYKGVDIATDDGEAAFEALEELKPNVVKTYSRSSDLVNMFTSGEISAAVIGNFAVPILMEANPNLVYITPEGTYANFNLVAINKNSKNKELAYAYVDYRLSSELQTTTGHVLNEAPTNKTVVFTEEEAATMTYGEILDKAKTVDYLFVNPLLNEWVDKWNRTLNN